EAPWLAPTRQLISRTVRAGTPFLGICLGHQLATVALGGQVCTSDHFCLGAAEMHLTPEGKKDPLLSVYDGHRGIHFNNDVAVVLPEDAVLLARDPTGQIEAVRFAERAWGVQFHPECTP
ncbi:type 1 glutamine amidotransferase, partial [Cutibacterium acnes subsp. acnes]|nr:type 1 glutamine amidotransferase [Cutibacterium acnes subsp. acnes]